MNFDFTDDQQAIKRTAREFLSERSKLTVARAASEGDGYDEALWKELVELGWPGIAIEETHGGQGLGTLELVILAEELGYALTPSPFLSNALAGIAIAHCGSDEQKQRWLPGIADGSGTGALGVASDGAALVPDAGQAAIVVVGDRDGLRLVEPSEARIEPAAVVDGTRSYQRVADGGDPLPGDAGAALDRAAVVVAAEIVGVCQRALEMSVEYAKEREQFGKPIGAFQAVSHRCAQMLLDTESARAATYGAAWASDAAPERLPAFAAMAKGTASEAAKSVTATAIQVHGGIGFTWEHECHLLYKRAQLDAQLLGGSSEHFDRLARLAGDRVAAAA